MNVLPSVVVPVFNALEALDASLASLDRTLPAKANVLIADDASTDPYVESLARSWCSRSRLYARYVRRENSLGWAANCNIAFAEIGRNDDAVIFSPYAIATPGWLEQMTHCAAMDARIATITPWSNYAEFCSFPRFCEHNKVPIFPEIIAQAASQMEQTCLELPSMMGACMYLRRAALNDMGGFDAVTFGSGSGGENDFSRRAAAMGWRNVLCATAYVVHTNQSALGASGENLRRLLARWPDYHELVAHFILSDPLRDLRVRLSERINQIEHGGPQRDLFV